jgi:patatin-related protein
MPDRALLKASVDPDTEEVRLAMALNGGVSLAVWMGGVAVELDAARRSELPLSDGASDSVTRGLYHGILTAFDRRLVIDIMSGASAGGLNGSLLAAAIRKGRRLPTDMLRDKWLSIGDFLKLLQPMTRRDPPSLMRGGASKDDKTGIFYDELRKMFSIVLGDPSDGVEATEIKNAEAPDSPAPLDVQLDVTMTNVQGEPRMFRDHWGNPLAAREYRSPLKFRDEDDFQVEKLATAARSSASFPFAFEPFLVQPPTSNVAGFEGSRYVIDGGLLENAPIDAAIRLIPKRPATAQVKRYVCYLNAAPPEAAPADPTPSPTTIENVAGWLVNLPRDARFVDQLYAVQDAQRSASVSRSAQPRLMTTPWPALKTTAAALLPTYRQRRLVLALHEILENDPWRADKLAALAGPDAAVGWLPSSVAAPAGECDWRWGIRTAQRILHMQIDLLRPAVKCAPDGITRRAVLEQRRAVFASLATVDRQADELIVAARAALGTSDSLDPVQLVFEGFQSTAFAEVIAATDAFLSVLEEDFISTSTDSRLAELQALKTVLNPGTATEPSPERATSASKAEESAVPTGDGPPVALAPPAPAPAPHLANGIAEEELAPRERFLQRALATEVIQRAFATAEDVEAGQELPFAQLTPLAPIQLFSSRPFTKNTAPDSGRQKLTGLKLLHFSAFYRKSWRANDFMWGRLDGATRIVDLLVDHDRAADVKDRIKLGEVIAEAVLPESQPADERHALVAEAFREARTPDSGVPTEVTTVLADYQPQAQANGTLVPAEEAGTLREDLASAIDVDLEARGDLRFTRTILARALQAAILREEYDHLTTTSKDDAEHGSFVRRLPDATDNAIESINAIRSLYYVPPSSGGKPVTLPSALGLTDPDEETSDLALRTLTRTLYATLAALRKTVILGRLLAVVRAPLLPISGVVARSARARAAVIIGFAAAATYLAARLLSTVPETDGRPNHPSLGELWDPAVLLSWMAVLVLGGAIIVPTIRALRARSDRRWRKLWLSALSLALIVSAFGVPIGAAMMGGHFGVEQLLGMPGAAGIPNGGTKTVLGLIVGTPVVLATIAAAFPFKQKLSDFIDRHLPFSILYSVVGAFVLCWSIWKITQHWNWNWRAYIGISAGAAALLFAIYIAQAMLNRTKDPLTFPPM